MTRNQGLEHLDIGGYPWDNDMKGNKNGPSVIGVEPPRLGPNHWIGVADMESTGTTPKAIARAELRFWSKVRKTDDCWEWTGYRQSGGYGRLYLQGGVALAHRFSYGLLVGEIPQGLEIDHLCRNTSCVNPDHLEAVTHQENMMRSANGYGLTGKCRPMGHEMTAKNTYITPAGARSCRTCKALKSVHYKAKRRALKKALLSRDGEI